MPHATQHADVVTAELDSALRGGPFHVALRAAIAARGLPLQRVQHHLSRHGVKVGVTSLSYWQQGARRPQRPESLRAVRALEEILQLPEESLIRLLAETDDRAGDRRSAYRAYRPRRGLGRPGQAPRRVRHPARRRAAHPRPPRARPHRQPPRAGGTRVAPHRARPPRRHRPLCRRPPRRPGRRPRAHARPRPGELPHRPRTPAPRHRRPRRRAAFRHPAARRRHLPLPVHRGGRHGRRLPRVRTGRRLPGGQYALQVCFDSSALPVRCHRFTQHSAAAPRGDARSCASARCTARCTWWNRACGRGTWGSPGTGGDPGPPRVWSVLRPGDQGAVLHLDGQRLQGRHGRSRSTLPVPASNSLP